MTPLNQIECPSCGANLGAESETGEYTCPYCHHVSHARLVRRAYGMDWNAVFQKENESAARELALEEQRRAERQNAVVQASSHGAAVLVPFGAASLLVGLALETYAVAAGVLGAAVAGVFPIALGGLLMVLGLKRRAR